MKSREKLGMETDQAEKLDVLLNQSTGHPTVSKARHDVSSTHVFPATSYLMPSTLHPSEVYGPQKV